MDHPSPRGGVGNTVGCLRVSFVACGGQHTLVLAEGLVLSFGCGRDGQLGHGDAESVWTPKVVTALERTRVVQVAAGGGHSMALTDSGVVFGWGHGEDGQLGIGDCSAQGWIARTPTRVHDVTASVALSWSLARARVFRVL